jgi:hypothetical protein
MIQILNGDFRRFDESIIAYSKVQEDHSQIFSIFATTKKADLKRKIHEIPFDSQLESIAFNEHIESAAIEDPNTFFGLEYDVKSEHELLWGPTCVLFVGDHKTIDDCKYQTLNAIWLYFKNIDMHRQEIPPQEPIPTHDDIPPKDMVKYLVEEYANKMYRAIDKGDKSSLSMLKQRFAVFSLGTSFYADARRLFDHISAGHDPRLVEKIMFKIAMKNASDKQEFELAARFRDMMKI